MLLTIDVGNTNIVFGLVKDNALQSSFRLTTDGNRTADEIGLILCEYLRRFDLAPEEIEDTLICSVVPGVMYALTGAVEKYLGKKPIVADEDVIPRLSYPGNERLGPDRSVACVAALKKYGAPLIVLDFGTATTMDAVGENGEYFGGCILAGMRTCTEALFQEAAMLPRIDLVRPKTVLSMTTVGQIQAGSVMGYIGATEYLIRAARQEMPDGDRATVVATGGLAHIVADSTDLIDVVDDGLILDGLCLLYEQYREEQGRG